ncbi:MAG: peptidase protein [Candidatus Berkelbacteria bacterium]|nr:peptidase protein [Candidatus Berkelbacteria bacterium]
MLDYKVSTFNNGLKLITAPLANTKAVTVLFLVSVGSRYEDKKISGISHFLEHLFFKGTKKRPTTLDISKTLDSVGASYNAFTGEEYTGFYVRASSEHFDLALDVLFDLLYNAKFDPEEIEKEKGVIIEEINMYQDTPQAFIVDLAKQLFYKDQSLGRPVTGEKETVRSITRQDLLKFRDSFYSPDNMIITVAGGPLTSLENTRDKSLGAGKNGIDWEGKIKEYFDKIKTKKQGEYEKVYENQTKPESLVYFKKTDQAHLVLGFRTLPRTDKRRPIMKVLNNLLGETMSSRLFTEVREKRGLAYYISSDIADFCDAGVLGVSAGVDINRAEEAVKVILDEFTKVKTEKVSPEELKRSKENMKGRLYLGLEESFAVADFLAEQQLFWEKIDDPEELVKKYEKVTAEDILNFAQKHFTSKNLNLAIIGPFKDKQKFQSILDKFK